MKSTELRIGNYVNDRGGKPLLIDYWEYRDKISEKDIDNRHPLTEYVNFLEPIPLTEEWLLKFGFDKKNEGVGFTSYHYSKMILEDSDKLYFRSAGVDNGFYWGFNNDVELYNVLPIQHVHQLQNLFFALTEKELTV